MKRRKAQAFVVSLIIVSLIWAGYKRYIYMRAWLWHLRNGNAVSIGTYAVPVPSNWYVIGQSGGGQLLVRIDTADRTPYKKLKSHASILIQPERALLQQDIERLLTLETGYLTEQGRHPILTKTLFVDGGTIFCIGGEQPGSMGIYDVEPVSWHCKSSLGMQLSALATEGDIKEVWEIVSGIRLIR